MALPSGARAITTSPVTFSRPMIRSIHSPLNTPGSPQSKPSSARNRTVSSRSSTTSPTWTKLVTRGRWLSIEVKRLARDRRGCRSREDRGARRPASCHYPVLEVGDAGRLDGPDLLELHLCVPEVGEEASTVAEHHRNHVELKFVQQSRCQVLPSDVSAAPKPDVFAAGGLPCLFERGLDSVGDEVERGPSLHLNGITRVMGENEHGVVVGRVVAPPARPLLVAPGTTADRPEHVSAHHAGPDVLGRLLEYPCALVHLAALLVVGLAPGGQRNHPVVKPLAALAERVLLALVRARDETVHGDRDMTPKLAHRGSSVGGRRGRTFSVGMTGPRRETNRGCATSGCSGRSPRCGRRDRRTRRCAFP